MHHLAQMLYMFTARVLNGILLETLNCIMFKCKGNYGFLLGKMVVSVELVYIVWSCFILTQLAFSFCCCFLGARNTLILSSNARAPQVYFVGDNVKNLKAELARGAKLKCSRCGLKGAALGCYVRSCRRSYHFPCAKEIPKCRWDYVILLYYILYEICFDSVMFCFSFCMLCNFNFLLIKFFPLL